MDRIKISIIDQSSGKKYHVVIPYNVNVSRLMPALIKQLKSPGVDANNERRIGYYLYFGDKRLNEDETLESAGVKTDDTLRLVPVMMAGGGDLVRPIEVDEDASSSESFLKLVKQNDYSSSIETSRRNISKVSVFIGNQNVAVNCSVPVKDLLPALITFMGLPSINAAGQPIKYQLTVHNQALDSDRSLASLNVVDGETLTITPVFTNDLIGRDKINISYQPSKQSRAGVIFSSDGQSLATCSDDGSIFIWDIQTGEQKLSLKGHTGAILSISFQPNGNLLVSEVLTLNFMS